MKIFDFTDLHGNMKALQQVKEAVRRDYPDLIVCTGDLTVFEHEMEPLLSRINLLGAPVIMLHGNHEAESRMRKVCAKFEHITFLHKQVFLKDDWAFVVYGGGGFDDRTPELEEFAKTPLWKSIDWNKAVFLTHAPPYNTMLDDVGEGEQEWHVGSKTIRDLIKKHQPRLALAGHLHECFRKEDRIGKTLVCNPGPNGRMFELEKLG